MRIDPKKNTIVCGDNLEWLKYLPDECIDLCYIDPPFFSNRNYEIIWGNGYEVCSFGDRFSGGISHYIEWMRPRIELIHKKLKSTGTIFLHCDWHASHRLRCLLDDVFKAENFVNEIIWCYKSGGASKKYFSNKHDTIFFYSKSNKYYFEPIKEKSYMQKGAGDNPNQKYYTDDIGKYTLVYMKDWWVDIGMLATSSFERIGYPTQKPEKLIERIVLSCSKKNDIILDCFAGGGTTAVVCAKLGRNFIVGDVSPVAVKVMAQRLNVVFPDIKDKFDIKNLPQTIEELQKVDGHKFAEIVCDLMGWKVNPKKVNDGGIDAWDGYDNPVQIKNNSSGSSGRPDMQKFYSAIVKSKKKKGIFISWKFASNAKEFVAEMKREQGIEIILKPCSEVFENLIIPIQKYNEINQFYDERCPKLLKTEISSTTSYPIKKREHTGKKIKKAS